MKVTQDIRIDWQSTPRLWMAYRGDGEHMKQSGLGRTPIEALAHLIEQELDADGPEEFFPRPHRHPGPVAGCPECIKEKRSGD